MHHQHTLNRQQGGGSKSGCGQKRRSLSGQVALCVSMMMMSRPRLWKEGEAETARQGVGGWDEEEGAWACHSKPATLRHAGGGGKGGKRQPKQTSWRHFAKCTKINHCPTMALTSVGSDTITWQAGEGFVSLWRRGQRAKAWRLHRAVEGRGGGQLSGQDLRHRSAHWLTPQTACSTGLPWTHSG